MSINASGAVVADASALVPSSHHGLRGGFYETRDQDGDVYAAMADGSVRCLPPGILSIKGPQASTNWPNIAAEQEHYLDKPEHCRQPFDSERLVPRTLVGEHRVESP